MNHINLSETAVVMELPSPVKEAVQKLRDKFDLVLADNIPVEITIAGSSGLGTIAPGQDSKMVIAELTRIAKEQPVIEACFGKVFRFPGSTVFALSLIPEDPFFEFQQRLKSSLIRFEESAYSFKPHCSVHIWGEVNSSQEKELLEVTLKDCFSLDSFALYQLVGTNTPALLERFGLSG